MVHWTSFGEAVVLGKRWDMFLETLEVCCTDTSRVSLGIQRSVQIRGVHFYFKAAQLWETVRLELDSLAGLMIFVGRRVVDSVVSVGYGVGRTPGGMALLLESSFAARACPRVTALILGRIGPCAYVSVCCGWASTPAS